MDSGAHAPYNPSPHCIRPAQQADFGKPRPPRETRTGRVIGDFARTFFWQRYMNFFFVK